MHLCVSIASLWLDHHSCQSSATRTGRNSAFFAHLFLRARVGAAITIGLTIWESQKGKTRSPVIIDDQFVSHRQR
jgi:hypothetical protein